MSAPRKERKIQSVRIRPMQSLTNSIEPTTALQEVTNMMKPVKETYQATTQVKVLSPEIINIIEVDVFHSAEDSTNGDDMGKSSFALSGSKSVALYAMEVTYTWEIFCMLERVCWNESKQAKTSK